MMSSVSSDQSSSPWLMLPPIFGGGEMVYKLYSLAEKRVLSFNKRNHGGAGEGIHSDELPDDDAEFVGSLHGWLALLNRRNDDLFLSNPITRRHIKLLPLDTSDADRSVYRVILTSSPDEEKGCLAGMVTFRPSDGMAFCSPGSATEWTLFGGDGGDSDNDEEREGESGRIYQNVVYSSRQKRLFCVTMELHVKLRESWDMAVPETVFPVVYSSRQKHIFCFKLKNAELDGWNLECQSSSPRLDWMIKHNDDLDFDSSVYLWADQESNGRISVFLKYLVYNDKFDELFLVVRHVNPFAGPDDCVHRIMFPKYRGCHARLPYKTIHFDVFKIDLGRPSLLNSSPTRSIYFADDNDLDIPTWVARTNHGGHDDGIFDYRKTNFPPAATSIPLISIKSRGFCHRHCGSPLLPISL